MGGPLVYCTWRGVHPPSTIIVSASRPPPRPLDAQRFFVGAVLGCFLAFSLSGYFLSLYWVLPGTPSNSVGLFVSSLRRLFGLSQGSWGLLEYSWELLEASWERLGRLLGVLWSHLGRFLELKRYLGSILEAIILNYEKPSNTL